MMLFLLVYNKKEGRLVSEREFTDSNMALDQFFLEEERKEHAFIEVVLLRAKDRENLVKTHSRYFKEIKGILSSYSSFDSSSCLKKIKRIVFSHGKWSGNGAKSCRP